jgi:hypothetical protein
MIEKENDNKLTCWWPFDGVAWSDEQFGARDCCLTEIEQLKRKASEYVHHEKRKR